jgi:citronellol/citronellal dehydrogenase
MSNELEGRTALVTGASRGIGAAIARRLAAAGAVVVVTARTTRPGGPLPGTIVETAQAITAAGGRAVALAADLSRPDERDRLVREAVELAGPIDVLVNNAAVTWFAPATSFDLRRWQVMFEVQVRAPLHLVQLVVPHMRARGGGWILNVSSGAARHPRIPPSERASSGVGTVYGMCKAALERMTTGLAAELYAAGIAVNALSPSRVVPTPGTVFHGLATPDDPEAEPPELMAEAALVLCSGDPRVLTGRIASSQELLAELRP